MTMPAFVRRQLLGCAALAILLPHALGQSAALPGDSVYQLRPGMTDQHGHPFDWTASVGQPVLVSMFYTSCKEVCPLIFETIKQNLSAIDPAERERVKVLMISFDPRRDSPAALARTAQAHHCDAHWTLVSTDEASTRKLAAVLGIQYRRLPDGDFNHSSSIILLDSQGRIVARSGKLGTIDPDLVQALKHTLANSAAPRASPDG